MADRTTTLLPISPFCGLPSLCTAAAGVRVTTRDDLGIASILAKNGKEAALAERVQERFGVRLPQALARNRSGGIALVATGPRSWLAMAGDSDHTFSLSLRTALGDFASVSDQSDGYAVLRVAGPKVRETLAKLIPIDVHARVFRVDMAVVTIAAHMGVTLWRIADEVDGASAFEIALYRSLAGSFWDVLCESASEFGLSSSDAAQMRAGGGRPAAVGPLR